MAERRSSKVNLQRSPTGEMGERRLATGNHVSMRVWLDEQPGGPVQVTCRDYETVGYVLTGRAELDIEGETIRLEPGDSWLVPSGTSHSYEILEPFSAVEAISSPAQSKLEPDELIQRNVLEELEFDPRISAQAIGVRVQEGIVTLTGSVDRYAQRAAAEAAVLRVIGVRGVANDIEIQLPGEAKRTDEDIARDALRALDLHADSPVNRLKISVDDGWVTVLGEVDWRHQRVHAEETIHHIPGVRGVTCQVEVRAIPLSSEVRRKIKAAFIRNAKLDAKEITVETTDHRLTLRGTVRSWAEKAEAERIAWMIPGVTAVENQLVVRP